ncbi:MAG: hypothetical protein WAR24_19540, partial [Candidatus Acidiferrales bacterium]
RYVERLPAVLYEARFVDEQEGGVLGSDYIRVLSWQCYQQPTVAQFQLVVGLLEPRTWNGVKLLQDGFLLFVKHPNVVAQHHRPALVLGPQDCGVLF